MRPKFVARCGGMLIALALIVAPLAPDATAAARASLPAPSPTRAAARAAAMHEFRAAAGRALGSHRGHPELTATIPLPCSTYRYTDPAHDTASSIDAVAYELQVACTAGGQSALVVHAAHGFNDADLGFIELDADTDGNTTNNCDGVDVSVVAGWVPALHQIYSDVFDWKGSCDVYNEMPHTSLATHAPGSNTVTLASGVRPKHWLAAITSKQNPSSSSDWDAMPNHGDNVTSMTSTTSFTNAYTPPKIQGTYTRIVPGDFNGDHHGDLLFYAAGGAPDYIWYGYSTGVFNSYETSINGAYTIVPGDFDGDGITDLLFYAPGAAADSVWYGTTTTGLFVKKPITINGSYTIVAGDFNGDHADDLFFYAPGTGTDYLGLGSAARTFTMVQSPTQINGSYRIAAGDFNGDRRDDIILYAPGTAPDHLLLGQADATFATTDLVIDGTYAMLRVGDFDGNGRDDILFFNPDTPPDALSYGSTASPYLSDGAPVNIVENYTDAVVTDWNNDGTDDLLFYGAGSFPERLWIGPAVPAVHITTTMTTQTVNTLVSHPFTLAFGATGGTPPYEWFATGLPTGLSIDSHTGTISGTPTTVATTPVTVTLVDVRKRRDHYLFGINAFTGFASLASGFNFSCAATNDGKAYCWGDGTDGETGAGDISNRIRPTPVAGISNVAAVAGSEFYGCALTSAGAVKCWGDNSWGGLGDGTTNPSLSPVQVSGLTSGVASIATGETGACAVMTGGALRCWGANRFGSVGDGTTNPDYVPTQVSGLTTGVSAVSFGDYYACAVVSGAAKCWGRNASGQLGNGTTTDSSIPVQVTGLTSGVVAIAAGGARTCAVKDNGTLYCWGQNTEGEIGDNTNVNRLAPVVVSGIGAPVLSVATGRTHTCALTTGHTVWCWGWNVEGDVGNLDSFSSVEWTPALVAGTAPGVTMLSAGDHHTCAMSTTTMQCWGAGEQGQLGDGYSNESYKPVDVAFTFP